MERKLQERMVGAGVLILVFVILGPMILSGGDQQETISTPGSVNDEVRSHTFSLDQKRSPTAGRPAAGSPTRAPLPPSGQPMRPPKSTPPTAAPASVTAEQEPAPVAAPPTPAPAVKASPAPDPASPPKPAPQVATAPAVARQAATSGWVVQVGTFGQKSNADRLAVSLQKSGFDAFVSATERTGKPLYRVRVGPAGSRDAANTIASRLAQAGQTGQVVSQ